MHAAGGRGVDAGHTSRTERVPGAVAEAHLDPALVHEVRLFLLVVVMKAALVTRRQHDRVDPKRGDIELATDLPEPIAVAHLIEARDRVTVAMYSVAHDA